MSQQTRQSSQGGGQSLTEQTLEVVENNERLSRLVRVVEDLTESRSSRMSNRTQAARQHGSTAQVRVGLAYFGDFGALALLADIDVVLGPETIGHSGQRGKLGRVNSVPRLLT